jgi:hypothetical protein
MRFQVLMVVSMKLSLFWDVVCRVVTLKLTNVTTWGYIPEDSIL